MSTDRSTREVISIEEAPIFNMLEIAAIVEVLERKGVLPTGKPQDQVHERRTG